MVLELTTRVPVVLVLALVLSTILLNLAVGFWLDRAWARWVGLVCCGSWSLFNVYSLFFNDFSWIQPVAIVCGALAARQIWKEFDPNGPSEEEW